MAGPKIVLGSRGSDLARTQTALVEASLRNAWPEIEIATQIISTRGDKRTAEVLDPRAGRKGLFTGEIEQALAACEIDVAVHSAKDLPSEMTAGLELAAVLARAPVEDVLIWKEDRQENGAIATGSVRRQHQFRRKYLNVAVVEVRGNVPTRLRKFLASDWRGIILARAGLERLGYDVTGGVFEFEGNSLRAELLACDDFIPAGGQGIVALQIRSADEKTKGIVRAINHSETLLCLRAEREFLRLLHGDCGSPVGVLATIENDAMTLSAQVFTSEEAKPKSSKVLRVPLLKSKPETVAALLYNFFHAQR